MTRGILTNKKIRSERKVHSVKSGMFDSTVKVSAHDPVADLHFPRDLD
jgi:hypothetical protein